MIGMSKQSIAIIGGSDGPTSVFVTGRKNGIHIKHSIKNRIYRWKGKQAAKRITAGERTLSEVVTYAVKRYNAVEADLTKRKYATQKNCLKESLVSRFRPELLEDLVEVIRPDDYTPETVKALQEQFQARRERIEAISEEAMPMDFHIYEIILGDGRLELEIDYHWDVFGVSYSGNKKTMKRMKEIAKDLYLYYGV